MHNTMYKKIICIYINLFFMAFATHASDAAPETDSATVAPKWRIGGYGEMLASYKDYGQNRYYGGMGNTKKNHAEISIPRFVLSGEYRITPKWILAAEIEFESGGTGMAYELESGTGSENGEYEVEYEKGGEVALEQFHITRLIVPEFNIRAGHLVLPIGLTNAHHEPLNFFTAARPEGSTILLPSTWHETGLELFGQFGKKKAVFNYQAMITAGLNPNGFNVYNWVKGGKQGLFETDNFTSPAYSARLDWKGVPGLRIGASLFYNPSAEKNCDKLDTYSSLKNPVNVLIYSFDAQYINKFFTVRANYLSGDITETVDLTARNRKYTSKSPYSRKGPIAKRALDYSVEVGLNVKAFFDNAPKFPRLYPFAHYNYYNPQEEGETGMVMEKRCQVSMWSFGINYYAVPGLVIKADYTTRQIGTNKMFGKSEFNSENEIRLGIAYALWFTNK